MITKFSFSTTAILLLSVWLFSACEESSEVLAPQSPTSSEASALTSPERLKAVLGSSQKVPFLVKHINTFTSMKNMKLIADALNTLTPEEYDQFIELDYDRRLAEGGNADEEGLWLAYRQEANRMSAEQHGLSYSALHGEPLNILTKQLDAQARFAKLTDRSAIAQDHVTAPNGRIDYTTGAGAKWIANRSIGMYYYENLDVRNGSRFTYIANAYDAIKQNVELEIYQTLVPSVPTSMYIAVDVAGFWPLYYTPQVYQGIDPYFGGNAFLIPFAYEYVGSDLFVEISAEPNEKRKYINSTFSLGDHVLFRANY